MFSSRLKKLRHENNLSQRALAEQVGFSQQAIAKWESDVASPAPDVLVTLAQIFKVSTDYLLGETDNPAPRDTETPYVSLEELALVEKYRRLDPDKRKALDTLLE